MDRRLLFRALIAGLLASRVGAAAASDGASGFIQAVGRELSALLRDATDEAQRRERLRPFLQRVVAVDRVARFCLGRYWRRAAPAQQQEYEAVFLDALAASVASRAGSYAGTTRIVTLPEIARADGTDVPTVVQSGGQEPVHVTWLVDTSATPFRILDVSAEGISLRLSLRSDYAAFLGRHGGDIGLFLAALRAHVGAADAQARP